MCPKSASPKQRGPQSSAHRIQTTRSRRARSRSSAMKLGGPRPGSPAAGARADRRDDSALLGIQGSPHFDLRTDLQERPTEDLSGVRDVDATRKRDAGAHVRGRLLPGAQAADNSPRLGRSCRRARGTACSLRTEHRSVAVERCLVRHSYINRGGPALASRGGSS